MSVASVMDITEPDDVDAIVCKQNLRDGRLADAKTFIMRQQALVTAVGVLRQGKGLEIKHKMDGFVNKAMDLAAKSDEILDELGKDPELKRKRSFIRTATSHIQLLQNLSRLVDDHYCKAPRPSEMPYNAGIGLEGEKEKEEEEAQAKLLKAIEDSGLSTDG